MGMSLCAHVDCALDGFVGNGARRHLDLANRDDNERLGLEGGFEISKVA